MAKVLFKLGEEDEEHEAESRGSARGQQEARPRRERWRETSSSHRSARRPRSAPGRGRRIAAEDAILLALILVPPLRHVFGLEPLGFAEWWILLLFPPAMLLAEEARKAVVRRAGRRERMKGAV